MREGGGYRKKFHTLHNILQLKKVKEAGTNKNGDAGTGLKVTGRGRFGLPLSSTHHNLIPHFAQKQKQKQTGNIVIK